MSPCAKNVFPNIFHTFFNILYKCYFHIFNNVFNDIAPKPMVFGPKSGVLVENYLIFSGKGFPHPYSSNLDASAFKSRPDGVPFLYSKYPAAAIMAPLSPQYFSSGMYSSIPCFLLNFVTSLLR